MDIDEIPVCRLCLKICRNGFTVMENTTQEMLNSLQLNLDLAISEGPVICNSCEDNLKECFNIYTNCRQKENHVIVSIEDKDVKQNMVNERLGERADVANVGSPSSSSVCCFCTELINKESFMYLVKEEVNVMVTLQQHLPQLALTIAEDSVTCSSCFKSLKNNLIFINNCLSVEENIKEFCKVNRTNSEGQIDLSNVLQFVEETEHAKNYSTLNVVKIEECEETVEKGIKVEVKNDYLMDLEEPQLSIKMEDVDIKTEPESCDRLKDRECTFESNYKNCFSQHVPSRKGKPEVTTYKCNICALETKHRASLQRHMLVHKNSSEVTMYKCETCPYKTKRKSHISCHMLTHRSTFKIQMYKCQACSFETKHKRSLRRHTSKHKSTSEVTMYKCEICDYETKRKDYVPTHMLIHETGTKVFKCEVCGFHTNLKGKLKVHKLTLHKKSSVVPMYNCEMCTFQSKHKRSLQLHVLVHQSDSEVTVYNCEVCSFQTKYKRNLQQHMMTHKCAAETTMYKCEICGLQTKYKSNLRAHVIKHKI